MAAEEGSQVSARPAAGKPKSNGWEAGKSSGRGPQTLAPIPIRRTRMVAEGRYPGASGVGEYIGERDDISLNTAIDSTVQQLYNI